MPHEEASVSAADSVRTARTVCFAGRSLGSDAYSTGGNADLGDLCNAMPGLIVDSNGPDSAYPFFTWDSDIDHAVDVIVSALDSDGDGRVTDGDAAVDLTIVGYSWGGFNARDVITAIQTDCRFDDDRRAIALFFALDPFRTEYLVFPEDSLDVPPTVQSFYEFEHSVAPPDDCSLLLFGLVGPFTGRTPYCTGDTQCHEYDFSLSADTASVDHCGIPGASARFVLELDRGQTPEGLPPEVDVARY